MGLQIISYEGADVTDLSLSTSMYHTYELWSQAALMAIVERLGSSNGDTFRILQYLFSKRRVAFLPIYEPASELGLYESKIGGLPYLLPSESWPCNKDGYLAHLWQLRVRDLPGPVQQALGYNQGLLQVFVSQTLDMDETSPSTSETSTDSSTATASNPATTSNWYLVRVLDEREIVHRFVLDIALPRDVYLMALKRVTTFECEYDFPNMDDALATMPDGMDKRLGRNIIELLQVCN
ncbi:hypothetical protein Vafri_607 [Volvox africanus]|nr:hypothetical protein Vafri_607 [Volvox africanus]